MTAAKKPATTRPQKPLPCPFCGGKPIVRKHLAWAVYCDRRDHYAHSVHWMTKGQAIAAWNRRAGE